jgi:hypothetical protein
METVVLVGHDNANRALLLQLLEQPLSAYWRIAQGPVTGPRSPLGSSVALSLALHTMAYNRSIVAFLETITYIA